MNEPAELRLSNGQSVRIVLNDDRLTLDDAASTKERIYANAGEALRTAMAEIRGIGNDVIAAISEIDPTPREVKVSFGVDLAAEAGITIAKMSTSANFTVTIVWEGTST